MKRLHNLKCWPEYFAALADGSKTFEVRYDDRGFEVGDSICVQEYAPGPDEYTGRELFFEITYKLSRDNYSPVTNGLYAGYCVLGLQRKERG